MLSSLDRFVHLAPPYLALAVATAALGVVTWTTLERGRVYSALFAALTFYGGATLLGLSRLANEFSRDTAFLAAYVFSSGSACLLGAVGIAELYPDRHTRDWAGWARRLGDASARHLAWASVLLPVSLAIFLFSRDSLETTWAEARADYGIGSVFAMFLLLLGFPGAMTGLMIGRRSRALVLATMGMATFVLSGSRAALLGGLALVGWWKLAQANSRAARTRTVLVLGALALLAHVALRFIRGVGPARLLAVFQGGDVSDLLSALGDTEDISGGEAAIPRYLAYAVAVNGSSSFGFMTSATRLFLLFLPGAAVGIDKPLDVTYRLWATGFSQGLFDGAEGFAVLQDSFISGNFGSLHPTLFGELFLSGGWISLIASTLLFGVVCVFIDRSLWRLKDVHAVLLLGPVLVGMFMIARGNSVIGFGYFFYLAVIVIASTFFVDRARLALQVLGFSTTTTKGNERQQG